MNISRQIVVLAAGFIMTVAGIGAAVAGLMGNLALALVLGFIMFTSWSGTAVYLHNSLPPPSQPEIRGRILNVMQVDTSLAILDVGVIAYWSEQNAYVFRTQAIPRTARSIQPYLQLQVGQAGTYPIEFVILDADKHVIFRQTITPMLVETINLIISPTHLHLGDLQISGTWTLHVSVQGSTHISHRITWHSEQLEQLEGHIDSDGEIDEGILPLLADKYAHPLSLDDLLTDDDRNEQQA